jgi:hypothetical protein
VTGESHELDERHCRRQRQTRSSSRVPALVSRHLPRARPGRRTVEWMRAPKSTTVVVTLMTLVVVSACGGKPARSAQALSSSPLVPKLEARRIAASWSGAHSYLPTWAPSDVVVSRWQIVSDAGAGNDRLVVRFRRRTAALTWQVSDSRELAWVRAQIDCRHPPAAPTTINGRTVYQRNEHGTEWAWICLSIGFPLTIGIEQRAGGADARAPPRSTVWSRAPSACLRAARRATTTSSCRPRRLDTWERRSPGRSSSHRGSRRGSSSAGNASSRTTPAETAAAPCS